MARKKGALSYEPEFLLQLISLKPQTTEAITKQAKKVFPSIHWRTVNNLLKVLEAEQKIERIRVSRFYIWRLPHEARIN